MKKRVLSLFMALVLCVSLAPTTVLATTGIDADSNVESADNNEKSADSNKNEAGTGAADAKDEENAGENGVTSDSGNGNGKTSGSAAGENSNAGAENDDKSSYDKNQDGKPNGGDAGENGVENGGGNAEGNADGNTEDKNDNGEDEKDEDDAHDAANDAGGGHSHCVCGETHRNIGDHDGEVVKTFKPWDSADSLPTTNGEYYLTKDVTISSNVELNANVTLCLHGKTVTVSNGAAIKINGGGTLILTDCGAGTIQGNNGKLGIQIAGSKDTATNTIYPANFVMYGGTISGFEVAVRVESHGSFTLYGGKITKNNTGSAAAVSGKAGSGATASITMYGGEISGNTGEAGGGVYVGEKCTFELKGGKISNNTATGRINHDTADGSDLQATDGGGGVYLDHMGSFEMTGGEISGNTANGNGGGICVMTFAASTAVTITNGTITNNTANGDAACGGGIYGGPAALTIKNTEISGNKCAYSGGGIFANKPLTLTDVQVIHNTANTAGGGEGGGVKMGGTSDTYEGESALTVSGNTSINENSPNNYYVDHSYLLPIKVSGTLGNDAKIGVCLNQISDTDVKFLPVAGKDCVVATAGENVTLNAGNFFRDSFNIDIVVRDDASEGVKFGLCDHTVPEDGDTCSTCGTKFVAVLAPEGEGAKKEYFRDLNGAEIDGKTGTLKLFQNVAFSKTVSITRSTLTLDLNGHTIGKAKGSLSPIRLGSQNSGNDENKYYESTLTVIDSSASTENRTLDAEFAVNARSALNLYDGVNAQGFRGTVGSVKLTRTGKLVSCGGRIETLWLSRTETPSDSWEGLRLWQDNNTYCTIGTIRNGNSNDGFYIKEVLDQTHPNCTLYSRKDGGTDVKVTGDYVEVTSEGVGNGCTELYLQACTQHEPTSGSDLKCKHCSKELVVEITATKGSETKTAYFTKDSDDTTRWSSGQDEAAAQLADWVKDGYTDAKMIPLADLQGTMRLTCDMTLVGTGREILGGVNVKDGAKVTFEGGTYKDSISVRGVAATFKGGTYYSAITVGSGKATFENGTFNSVTVSGGTATVESGATFAATNDFAGDASNTIEVTGGTLNVEGGTVGGKLTVKLKGSLTISDGKFTNEVTINSNTSGVCAISGGTFEGTVNVWTGTRTISGGTFAELKAGTGSTLFARLAEGCAYYDQSDNVVNGEVENLKNVTVKAHTHSFDADGKCKCGAQMAASVTVGSATSYYASIEAAVKALNDTDGEKTLKLFQSRKGNNYKEESYTLTKGPVTLDVNGQWLDAVTFVAKGITLTLEGAVNGGVVSAVQAVEGGKVIATREDIADDGNVTVRTISAKDGGKLELSAGTFQDLYVVKNGSAASLAGGTYEPISYDYGKGPDGNTTYVGAYELLAKEYGYQKKQNDGSFKWVANGVGISNSPRGTYKVEKIGASFEGIYPDGLTGFTGGTYTIRLMGDKETADLTLTAKGTPADKVIYQWRANENGEWKWLNQDTAVYSGVKTATLKITGLDVGTYRYEVYYTLQDGSGDVALTGYSEALTVVVTKHTHSWTYTAEGATITAKCNESGCYLDNGSGGSVTIHAPERKVYEDGKNKEATVVWSSDWVADVAQDTVKANYTGTIANGNTYNGGISAPADAGEYTASITVGGETAKVKYTIGKATLTVEGTAAATAAYKEGLRVHNIDITGLTVKCGETVVKGTWKFDQNFGELNVGDTTAYTATFTPSANKHNYETLTKDIVPIITKGTYGRAFGTTKNVMTDEAQIGVEVKSSDGLMPYIAGAKIIGASVESDPYNIIRNVTFTDDTVKFDVAKADAGKTATITVTYSSDNYNDFTGTITVKTVTKERATVSIEGMPESLTYGQTFTLTATQTGDTAAGGTWFWDYDQTHFKLVDGDVNTDTITLQVIKVRAESSSLLPTLTTVTYNSETHKGDSFVSFNAIAPKTLTAGDLMRNGSIKKVYDGTTSAPVELKVSVRPEALVGNDTLDIPGTLAYNSANVSEANTITFISDAITSDNYQLAVGTVLTISAAYIRPAPLTVEGTGTASGVYGKKLSELDVSGLTAKLNGTTVAGTWRLTGDTIPDVGDAGTYTATFTPETGANNYNVLTKDGVKLAISKATYGGEAIAVAKDVPANKAQTGVEVDMTEALKGFKGAQVKRAAIDGNNDGVLTGTPEVVGGKVKFDVASVAAGKTATIRVTIECTNYEGVTAVITVKTVAQQSGGGYYYKSAAGGAAEAEKSPGTGDAGLLVYGLTALGGYTGAALVLRRRKREE